MSLGIAASSIKWPNVAQLEAEREVAACIDPLADPRWNELVGNHTRSTLFHSSNWLKALSQTYGYTPVAYTTSALGERLQNALVFCRVESWLTGRRLVSLPFSDHCDPLVDTEEDAHLLMTAIEQEASREQWRYIEMRPTLQFEPSTSLHRSTIRYTFHELDLTPDIDTLFRHCHKDSTQRKIRRAEREHLQYCEGSSEALLDIFYRLFTITRKRHHVPPPPRSWFVNLMECFGDALKIRVALQGQRPVAAIITIRHKNTLTYKYGGCDSGFTNLGSMHFLLWKSIQEAKAAGLQKFDFGRSDADQQGLITFKSRWGSTRSDLHYARYSLSPSSQHFFDLSSSNWKSIASKFVISHSPNTVLSALGSVLYGHVG